MLRTHLFASLLIVFAVSVMQVGCSNQPSHQQAGDQTSTMHEEMSASGDSNHEQHMGEGGMHVGEEMPTHANQDANGPYAEALAKLSPEDRALAEKQKVCPVSGDPLGSMGTPYKVTVEGQDVLLCCSGCESKIKANPEEYLAKLAK